MKTFDDILRTELQKPVALKNGNGATIEPMEAMVKSVLNNAMKGDLAAIAFVRTLTASSDPERERQAQERHQARLAEITGDIIAQLKAERAYDGQDTEIRLVAETAVLVEKLNDLMAEPDFQMVATDIKTGHQTVSPVTALRDKQRDLFQQQLAKLREEALRRSITRKNMRI